MSFNGVGSLSSIHRPVGQDTTDRDQESIDLLQTTTGRAGVYRQPGYTKQDVVYDIQQGNLFEVILPVFVFIIGNINRICLKSELWAAP